MTASRLSLLGQPITDAVRAAAKHGDGRLPESSMGIWAPKTNLVINGGFESNLNSWYPWVPSGVQKETIARTPAWAKFGQNSMLLTALYGTGAPGGWGAWAYELAASDNRYPVTAGLPYSLSGWFKNLSGSRDIWFEIDWYSTISGGTGFISIDTVRAPLGVGEVKRLEMTAIAPPTAIGAMYWIGIEDGPNDQAGDACYCDGFQFEQSPFPTPYIETDGAAKTRPDGSIVKIPSSLLTASQGWVAFRVRPAWAAGGTEPAHYLFEWTNPAYDHYWALWFATSGQRFKFQVGAGGDGPQVDAGAMPFAAGSEHTVIAAWTPTTEKISVDGAPFVSTAIASTPSAGQLLPTMNLLATDTLGYGLAFDGDAHWFACGTGTLSDADAARFHALGNTDPQFGEMMSAGITAIVPFDSDVYRIPALHSNRPPRIVNMNGPVEPGELLILDPGEWDGFPTPEIGITWERAKLANFNDVLEIPEEHGTSYRVKPWDRGYYIRAKVGVGVV